VLAAGLLLGQGAEAAMLRNQAEVAGSCRVLDPAERAQVRQRVLAALRLGLRLGEAENVFRARAVAVPEDDDRERTVAVTGRDEQVGG